MAGIYFHIPFCKQACHYCDFHFSTSLRQKQVMLDAMRRELELQKHYLAGQSVETIYFGGGTPSLLTIDDILSLLEMAGRHYTVHQDAEITLEANPDDLDDVKVAALRSTPVNRFSIGIQSFFEEDLRWMNRAHNAKEAEEALKRVQQAGYTNITADLIYGYSLLDDRKWQHNINKLLTFDIPHISAYSMTVEPRTALASFIRKGKYPPLNEGQSAIQFETLMASLVAAGYIHYEVSNFAKAGHYARHNSNYWQGVPYLGIGPSAHSYNRESRQWNVSNNAQYIRALLSDDVPCEKEILEEEQKLNEYIMTALRTVWGMDLRYVQTQFGEAYADTIRSALRPFLVRGEVSVDGNVATLTPKGKLLADYITAQLFIG